MKTNPKPIQIINKRPRNCEGFKDSLGKPLLPGDEIIVHSYNSVYHAVITRFTPRRVYWKVLYADESTHDYLFDYENFSQLHMWYSTSDDAHRKPEDQRRLRNVMKLEDPVAYVEEEIQTEKPEVY